MFREFFLAKLFFTFWRKKMPLNITEFFFKKLCIHRHSCPIQCCKSLNFYSCMTCTWHKRGERNTTLKLAFFPHFFATFLPAHWQAHRAFHGNDIFFPICTYFFMANARNLLYNWFLRKFDFQFSKIVKKKNFHLHNFTLDAIKFRFRSYHIYLSKSAKK